MQKHPRKQKHSPTSHSRKSSAKPALRRKKRIPDLPRDQTPGIDWKDFLSLIFEHISQEELDSLVQRKNAAGRPQFLLTRSQLLLGLIFHCTISCAGTFGRHLMLLTGIKMAESSLSQRRQALPFVVFKELLARMLGPITKPGHEVSYKGLRLIGVDGVGFSLPNTPQVKAGCKKGKNQRGKVAFAKLQCSALVELALHNPLAAAIGWEGQSEWKLAKELLDKLPQKCLLLADRLYGCGSFISAAMDKLKELEGHFLFRVKKNLKVRRRLRRFKDGSQMVEIHALDPEDYHKVTGLMQVREICARINRPGYRSVKIRLWTSLSCEQGSAQELVALYGQRWEQELYFRELKNQLGINDLLRSQTPETAAQEVAAMIIGSSLVSHERAKLNPGEALPQRVSFLKTWELLEPLWLTLLLGDDLLSEEIKQALCRRFFDFATTAVMQKKRTRSCPRAMRQPSQPWPRKRNQKSYEGTIEITIRPNPL